MPAPLPLDHDGAIHRDFPLKYSDDLYIREFLPFLGKLQVSLLRMRVRVSPPDPSAATIPLFEDIKIPNLTGRAIVGAYAHPFSVDVIDPSNPDPDPSDSRIVRPIFAIRSRDTVSMYLLYVDSPGDWPGTVPGSLEDRNVIPTSTRWGGAYDFIADKDAAAPVGASYLRPYIVVYVDTVETGDPSDPSAVNTYTLTFANGASALVDVNVLADQPAVGSPWPLDVESTRFNHQVLDTHVDQAVAYPRRNAYIVENLSDDPQHNERAIRQGASPYTVVDVLETQDTDNPSVTIQRVSLANGATVTLPVGVTQVVGKEYDPSGVDPSAGDPSGLSQEALNPSDWWEFAVLLVTSADVIEDDSLAGFAPDPWLILPFDLNGDPSNSPIYQ